MKHITFNKIIVFLVLALALITLVGCTPSNVTPIEGTAREAVLAKAEPITNNLFAGLEKADYAAFTRDFGPEMKAAIDQARFEQMKLTLDTKVGKFQSCEVAKVEQAGKYQAVNYLCKFEKEEAVSWRVVLTPTDPALISGLWYDSPKLRTK